MCLRVLCASILLAGMVQADDPAFRDLSGRADAARNANDVPQAVALYRQALALNPKWDQGWWYLGTLLYDADQYTGGRDALSRLVELTPNAGPAWGLLGLCEFETGDYAQALAHIERSLASTSDLQPGMDRVLRYHEALLLTRTGQFDRAVQTYSALIRSGSQSPELVSAVGLAALRTALLPKDIPIGQESLYQTAGKASLFTMSGDLQRAQQTLDDLAARFPDAPNVHYLCGTFLLVADTARAVEEFKRELKLNPSNSAAGAMLAWVLLRDGEINTALPYAEKAATTAPDYAIAQFVYGRLLVETGSVERGIQQLETARKIDPSFLETHLSLATAYSRIGRTEQARREREISLELAKESSPLAQR
jgi:tetratricopeptide (TPR) repeat protein